MLKTEEHFMKEAYKEALKGFGEGEIPVGAVIVSNGQVIARAHNQVERLNDPTAHAEMIAITSAANHLGTAHLRDCALFVTLEPCAMCMGAIREAQIRIVVFGAEDNRKVSKKSKVSLHGGVMGDECSSILHEFFDKLRREGD